MKPIFIRTLSLLFKPVIVFIYSIVNMIAMIAISQLLGSQFENFPDFILQQQAQVILICYLIMFVWLCGVLVLMLINGIGTGIFNSEEADGTMRILLSKPIRRSDMIIGKIAAILFGSSIYLITSIIISLTILFYATPLDIVVFNQILPLLPLLIIYGLFIIFVFSSIASLLSAVFKKRVLSLMIMMIIILVIFVGLPMLRFSNISNLYESYHLYLFDMNYHFGQIFTNLIHIFTDFSFNNQQKILLGNVLGIFKTVKYDYDISSVIPNEMMEANYLNGYLLFFIYVFVSSSFYVLTFLKMEKKDIN